MRSETDVIRSDRLDLHALTEADAGEMVEVLADSALYAFTGGSAPMLEELRERYRRLATGHSADGREEWRNWIVRTRADGRTIGTVQATITDNRQRASIAWVIGLRWQGQGFATEAARALVAWLDSQGIASITANVHPDHVASATVAARVGLVPTDDLVHGERIWRRPQPNRNTESSATTDESR